MDAETDCEVTIGVAAEILGCHRSTVRVYAEEGFMGLMLPYTRRNGWRYFKTSDLREFKRLLEAIKDKRPPQFINKEDFAARRDARREVVDRLFSQLGLSRD